MLIVVLLAACTRLSNPIGQSATTAVPNTTSTPTEIETTPTTILWPVTGSIDIVQFQLANNGEWFTGNLFELLNQGQGSEAQFIITDEPERNRKDGQVSSILKAGYLFVEWDISRDAFDEYDHTIDALFIRSSLMSFVDYSNNRVIRPWPDVRPSIDIPLDIQGIIRLCNQQDIPVFIEVNYSDYIPGPIGTSIESLERTDTLEELVNYLHEAEDEGLKISGITFGDELEDPSGYGELKPTIHNSDFIGRFIRYAGVLKTEFPELKIYAFDSSINAAQGKVSKYWDYFKQVRQAELQNGIELIDGFVFRESYVYMDMNGEVLDSQFIVDDVDSLYRDAPVFRYDVTGEKFQDPDRDYLHTLLEKTDEIFDRPIDIGITEYLPAGPISISETDTSKYGDMEFIIHYSDLMGVYAELGLDVVSTIMFGDTVDMHKAYFDRDGNRSANYKVHEQFAEYFAGEIIQVVRNHDDEATKVKVYATRSDGRYLIVILNKDVSNEHTVNITLPGVLDIDLRLPRLSYTSLLIDGDKITISGIGN